MIFLKHFFTFPENAKVAKTFMNKFTKSAFFSNLNVS